MPSYTSLTSSSRWKSTIALAQRAVATEKAGDGKSSAATRRRNLHRSLRRRSPLHRHLKPLRKRRKNSRRRTRSIIRRKGVPHLRLRGRTGRLKRGMDVGNAAEDFLVEGGAIVVGGTMEFRSRNLRARVVPHLHQKERRRSCANPAIRVFRRSH